MTRGQVTLGSSNEATWRDPGSIGKLGWRDGVPYRVLGIYFTGNPERPDGAPVGRGGVAAWRDTPVAGLGTRPRWGEAGGARAGKQPGGFSRGPMPSCSQSTPSLTAPILARDGLGWQIGVQGFSGRAAAV